MLMERQSSPSFDGGGSEIPVPPVEELTEPGVPKMGEVYATWMHPGPKLVVLRGVRHGRGGRGGSKRRAPVGARAKGIPRNSRIT